MKGIAIGLSNNSKEILKRLKKTEFVKDIYIAGSSKEDGKENELIQVEKPREILLKKWPEINLIIFIGSIAASIRIINTFLTSKDQDPGVIVIDNKCSKIVPIIGLHQSNTQNIAFQIANLLGGEVIETNNSNDQSFLNLDGFGTIIFERSSLLKNFIGKFFSSESSKIPFSSFLISIVANPAIDCCDIFPDSKKLFKEFSINSLLVFLSHPMPIHNTGGCQVVP